MDLYKYDTHVHTSETSECGKLPGKEVVRLYKKAGYQGIFITDHYFKEYFDRLPQKSWHAKIQKYLEGYRNASAEGHRQGLNVMLGIEIRFTESYNDYLVYGLDESFLEDNGELYKLGLIEFKKLASEKGFLVFQAHPFRASVKAAEPSLLDGIEIYNGNPRQDSWNFRAYSYAVENSLKMISGSDFHQVEDLARGGIVVKEKINTPGDLVRVINENKIIKFITTD